MVIIEPTIAYSARVRTVLTNQPPPQLHDDEQQIIDLVAEHSDAIPIMHVVNEIARLSDCSTRDERVALKRTTLQKIGWLIRNHYLRRVRRKFVCFHAPTPVSTSVNAEPGVHQCVVV
jgi:hypothetical protein